ncbi:MAG: hypothetical protein AAF471_05780 [Myxococcota bacterium]
MDKEDPCMNAKRLCPSKLLVVSGLLCVAHACGSQNSGKASDTEGDVEEFSVKTQEYLKDRIENCPKKKHTCWVPGNNCTWYEDIGKCMVKCKNIKGGKDVNQIHLCYQTEHCGWDGKSCVKIKKKSPFEGVPDDLSGYWCIGYNNVKECEKDEFCSVNSVFGGDGKQMCLPNVRNLCYKHKKGECKEKFSSSCEWSTSKNRCEPKRP